MTSSLVTSRTVKMLTVEAAQRVLTRAGCIVTRAVHGDVVTLSIRLPDDSDDPHGDRLLRAREAQDSKNS